MSQHAITIQIPEDVYTSAQQAAQESDSSIESVIASLATLAYGKTELTLLETLPDEELWRLVWRPLPVELEIRLEELSDLGDRGKLTDGQRAELKKVVAEVNRFVLIRSKALLFLKKRGYDIESYLEKAE